jgi:glycosyltransferase involved in cell wall biosynthesis
MRLVSITAGAGGMFCGSCMKDNALAAALNQIGHDVLLVPTYTPITTDDGSGVAQPRVFLGGVSVYLQQVSGLFRYVPKFVDRALHSNKLLTWAGGFVGKTDYRKLGPLTISMLKGTHGRQRKEMLTLVNWLKNEIKPEAILMTNALLSGLVPPMREALGVPIWTTLQGDDLFLDGIFWRHKETCLEWIRRNDEATTGYIATSIGYADHMAKYLGIDRAKMHVVHPGLNPRGHAGPTERPADRSPTLGYFGRFAPEKGFQNAVTAYLKLKQLTELKSLKFRFGGWLGQKYETFFKTQKQRLIDAGHAADIEHVLCPDLASKVRFFQSIDVFTMPTMQLEPKGLPVLEAWANGVPVVQPNFGSFPELIAKTGGGLLYPPGDETALANRIADLLLNPTQARTMGQRGHTALHAHLTARHMAEATIQVFNAYR